MPDRKCQTLDDAYQQMLSDILDHPEYCCAPRQEPTQEILGYKITIEKPADQKPISTADPERNKIIAKYTAEENRLFRTGTRSAARLGRAAQHWKRIANPDGTVNSAYGYLIWGRKVCGQSHNHHQKRTPWNWAMDKLRHDPETRQAILHHNTPDMLWTANKDIPCTTIAHFVIRNNQLHLFVDMRSNDIVWGTPYNLVWFAGLLHQAQRELHTTLPQLQVGQYTHYTHSLHLYQKQKHIAQKMRFHGESQTRTEPKTTWKAKRT